MPSFIRLEPVSEFIPKGFDELIADIGAGENGFSMAELTRNDIPVEQRLQICRDGADPLSVKSNRVPQTVCWIVDESDTAVGIVKVRHYLNEQLLIKSGHIGFFIRRDMRGKGYGKKALLLALAMLKHMGQSRVLITVNIDNMPSNAVVQQCGGNLEDVRVDKDGQEYNRFWIDV
jgi:predicted acetyltransferase